MSNAPISLVTKREKTAENIHAKLVDIANMAKEQNFCGMAVIIIKADGDSFVSTIGNGNRTLMLGAVSDLQYTLAKDGDKV